MTNSEQTAKPTSDKQSGVLAAAGDTVADGDNIYLDLDTLLDTRLGTLAVLDTKHAVEALNSSGYHKRLVDEFSGVSNTAFKEAYAARNIDTLKKSVLSNMVFFLRRIIKDSLLAAVTEQKVERLCFTVNVYPYDFSDTDLVELLIGCIRFHTYSTSNVHIVSIPNEELTPAFCNDNYQIMIRYEWVKWVEAHKDYFEKKGIPNLTMVVPELFYEAVPTQEDIEQLGLKKKNPFRMTEEIVAGLFRLKHMPVSLFSIHENITKESVGDIVGRVSVTQKDIEDYLDKNHPGATLVQDSPLPNVDLSEAFNLL